MHIGQTDNFTIPPLALLCARCLIASAAVLLSACSGGGNSSTPTPTPTPMPAPIIPWVDAAPLQLERQEVAVAALGQNIYVIGGFMGASILASMEVYDSANDSWSYAAPLPTPIHHAAAAVVDDQLYVIGGWNNLFGEPLADLWLYNPATDQWQAKTPMPQPRGSPAAAVIDNKIYVAGGWPLSRSQDFAVYDPQTDSWQTLADLPSPRNHLGAAAVNGQFYAVGGRESLGAGQGNRDAIEMYDPGIGQWSVLADMPQPRGGLAVVAYKHYVLAFGGEGNASRPEGTFVNVDAYNTESDSWQALADMPLGVHGIGAALLNGRVHIPGGGPLEGGSTTDRHQVYDPASEL